MLGHRWDDMAFGRRNRRLSRIIVNGPDGNVEHTLELGPNGSVLIGRAPAADVLHPVTGGAGAVAVCLVSAPSVSANHLLAWTEQGTVCVQDLGSRNGTWLLLPREQPVRVGTEDVTLQLARPVEEAPGADEPAEPKWSGPADFAQALAGSIGDWLRLQGLDVAVSVVSSGAERAEPRTRIPVVTGELLDVVPLSTADANWTRLLEQLFRWVARQNSIYEAEDETRQEGLVLASPAIRSAHRDVVDAAQADARTLLLTGPSGVGKEMLAEVFHRHSRGSGPFVAVNCSLFSKELLRSELFGAEPGSFTGASRRIIGAVERAQGGILFLDEIGDLPAEIQPMLLRFLDRREYENLGQYGKVQRADVRVVAATNFDLREATREGKFRADLWYRLSVHVVEVPPLRRRWDDVVEYLKSTTTGDGPSLYDAMSPAALGLLRAHPWEGNFRELTNFRQRLPKNVTPGSIDAATCRRALEVGSLRPLPPSSPPANSTQGPEANWVELTARAIRAFVEDYGRAPGNWDDQKEWNEKYLKPILFHELSRASESPPLDADALSALASRSAASVQADRGTALKQLSRYFQRFGSER
jgi:DNA-binding NtrC family response regulator